MITHTSSLPSLATTSSAHPARRAGLRIGAVLLLVELVHGAVGIQPLPLPITALFFVVAVAGLLLAGGAGAAASGRITTGALAGALAAMMLGAGYAVGTALGAATNFGMLRAVYATAASQAHIGYSDQLVVFGIIVTVLLAFIVGVCSGALCGAVGGWLGRRYARRRSA